MKKSKFTEAQIAFIREVGLPAMIRVDQGGEFVSRDLDLWAYQRGA